MTEHLSQHNARLATRGAHARSQSGAAIELTLSSRVGVLDLGNDMLGLVDDAGEILLTIKSPASLRGAFTVGGVGAYGAPEPRKYGAESRS